MKLLILGSKEYPMGTSDDPLKSGGYERYTESLVKHMKEKIDDVKIITRKFEGTKSYERDGNIEIFRLPWLKGFYLRNPSFNIAAFFKALTLDFDIVLTHGPVSSILGGLLVLVRGKKQVARPAGVAYVQPQYGWLAKKLIFTVEKLAYRVADTVVFLSEAEKDQFEKKLGNMLKSKIVIPTGVDVLQVNEADTIRVKEEFGIENQTVLTFVGRLIGVKGTETLIQSLIGLDKEYKAVIVGEGPDREWLEEMVKQNLLEKKVVFAGWRRDVPTVLAISDIFVLPSYSEGLPLTLLEAMAAGTACVVTDIGLPVKHQKDVIVFRAGDSEGLKKALFNLLLNKDLRMQLGREARKKAEKEFTWERTVEKYLGVFKKLSEPTHSGK